MTADRRHLLILSDRELATLYYDNATADGPWPVPPELISAEARESAREKLARVYTRAVTDFPDGRAPRGAGRDPGAGGTCSPPAPTTSRGIG